MNTEEVQNDKQLQEMESLLEKNEINNVPQSGDIVNGKVIHITNNEVLVDLNGTAVGVVRGPELYDASGEYSDLSIGDKVEATVIDVENERGEVELSFALAGHQKAWERLEEFNENNDIVPAKIVSANKGGLMARVGHVTGFLPVSQLSPENYPRVEGGDKQKILERLNKLVNKTLDVKIIDVDEQEEKLIVSEKAAWEEQQKSNIAKYKVGDVVEGTVTGIIDFGAFVEFGDGLEGLVHISELAWQRIDDPKDIVKVGDTVKAAIISIDGSRISLSMKKLEEDPWIEGAKKYTIGDIVKGEVIKVNPFGLFVELDKDIHGLAHISELADSNVTDPRSIAKVGDKLDFKIISIEPKEHRLGLSLKTDSTAKEETKAEEKKESDENEA